MRCKWIETIPATGKPVLVIAEGLLMYLSETDVRRLLEEWHFSQDANLEHLCFGYRMAYKLAGAFRIDRLAHRIVTYQLSEAP